MGFKWNDSLQAFEVDLFSQTRVYNKLGGKNPQFYVMRGGKSDPVDTRPTKKNSRSMSLSGNRYHYYSSTCFSTTTCYRFDK